MSDGAELRAEVTSSGTVIVRRRSELAVEEWRFYLCDRSTVLSLAAYELRSRPSTHYGMRPQRSWKAYSDDPPALPDEVRDMALEVFRAALRVEVSPWG